MSDGGGKSGSADRSNDKGSADKAKEGGSAPAERQPKKEEEERIAKSAAETTATTKEEGSPSSAGAAQQVVAQQLQQLQHGVKHVMKDLPAPGDVYTLIFITSLLFVLVLAPIMIRKVKQNDDYDDSVFDDFFSADDPIDDLTKLARQKWGRGPGEDGEGTGGGADDDEEGGGGGENKTNALEYMLKDVLKSNALQQAAQDFIVRTLESERVQASLRRLVKQLFSDLVQDPETVAQVIKLLQFAIQDPDVKKAAQQLVLEVVDEPQVKQSLIELMQKLGEDEVVRQATQSLIQDSTHRTLDDPDILEHSMEFATDVLGDDIVQRTAGEALRNTVGHAIQPATHVVLTAAGVGLLIFGIVAIGYARSSEQEARLFERAAKSLSNNASYGIMRILTWPKRALESGFEKGASALTWPFRFVHEQTAKWINIGLNALSKGWTHALSLPGRGVRALGEGVVWSFSSFRGAVSRQAQRLWQAATAALIAVFQAAWAGARSTGERAQTAAASRISQFASWLVDSLSRWAPACRQSLDRYVSRTLDDANDALNKWGLYLDGLIEELCRQVAEITGRYRKARQD